jgi:hypothetical protein
VSDRIVYTMPLSDLIAAMMEESVGKRGKPHRVVASAVQIGAWIEEGNLRSRFPSRETWGSLTIIGIPVEPGPDAQPRMLWEQEIKAREKVAA